MVQYLWQDDLVSVVRFIAEYLDVLQAAPSSNPALGGWTDVIALSLSLFDAYVFTVIQTTTSRACKHGRMVNVYLFIIMNR